MTDQLPGLLAGPVSRPDTPGNQPPFAINQESGGRATDPIEIRKFRIAIKERRKRQFMICHIPLDLFALLGKIHCEDDEPVLLKLLIQVLE